jgi:uncharacterized spore protein YtfJ
MGTPITSEALPGESSSERLGQGTFLETLADELAGSVCAVFGSPIEREGVTVIPVAKARWGMGGGLNAARRGEHSQAAGEATPRTGIGGGGAAMVKPLGFIEVAGGTTRFRPIRDPGLTALTYIASGLLGLSAVRAIVGGRRLGPRGVRLMRRRRRAKRLLKFLG